MPPGIKSFCRSLSLGGLYQHSKVVGVHRSPACSERDFLGASLAVKGPLREFSSARQRKVELERVVKDVLMRLYGVQKGCVKIAELFVSILFAPVAQRIERRFPKPCVGGSSPLGGASVFGSAFGGPFLLGLSLLQGYRQKSVSAT